MSTEDPGAAGEPVDPRASVKKAFADLDKKLGRKRKVSLPRIPWVTLLQFGVVLAVVVPLFWVVVYKFIEAPGTALMMQRWTQGETIRHQNVKFTDISPNVVRAVIAAEDSSFCTHKGFDIEAIQAAYASNMRQTNQAKGKVRGGSTISQQTAKNLFTLADRSFVRKGLETYFTFMAEHLWDKKRIMEAYLNAAEWGDGVFGIQAAAQARFKVSAGQLTPYQAALLAAVLPSPNKWSATNPGPYVRRRAATIAARMNAVRAQGLDSCVLGGYEAPQRRAPAQPLPPLEALPPDVALEADAPMMEPAAEMIPTELDDAEPVTTPGFEDGSLEAAPEMPLEEPDSAPAEAAPPQ